MKRFMPSLRGSYGLLVIATLISSVLNLACSSCGPEPEPHIQGITYECDGDLHTNTIDASEWVREHTEIARYAYASDVEADLIAITLLDSAGGELGLMTVEGYFGVDQGVERQVRATFERQGDQPLELFTDAIVSNQDQDEFRTRNLLVSGEEQVLIRADFKALDCYANEAPEEGQGHPCAWPLPVFESAYSVPSCGFDVIPGLPAAPNLTALEYRVPSESDPNLGGFLYSADDSQATFEVVQQGGRLGDVDDLQGWLAATGADAIIGSDSERLLAAAYVDPSWMEHVEAHAAECARQAWEDKGQQLRLPIGLSGLRCDDGTAFPSTLLVDDDQVRTIFQPGGGNPCEDCAEACGKPHLRTFDGSSFAFHAAGEFILANADFGNPWQIQVRTEPAASLSCRSDISACQNITVISAVAFRMGAARIAVYRDEAPHLWINGQPVERISAEVLSGISAGASIHQRGERGFKFYWPGGEKLEVAVRDHQLDMQGTLPKSRFGQISGLWGNYTNITSDDFKTRDGRIIEKPFTFEEFYGDFVNSWRVEQSESLFDYAPGEDTSTFTFPELPEEEVDIDDLPDDVRLQARAACRGVTGHPDHNWCIFDVACMCDDELVASTEHLSASLSYTDMHMEAPVTLNGDICLGTPDSFDYSPAGQASCPPEVDECISFVREAGGVTLSSALEVDVVEAGRVDDEDDLSSHQIAPGTSVHSFLLHLNEVPQRTGALQGELIFAHDVLGVIVTDAGLASSDALFAIDGADFAEQGRGVDFDGGWIEIKQGGRAVEVRLDSESGINELRVITASGQ